MLQVLENRAPFTVGGRRKQTLADSGPGILIFIIG